MARIRTIKPEFWSSEQVMECSPLARLMFIGIWNFCDDGGRHPASAKTIKALVFPGDDITADEIQALLLELSLNGLLSLYEASGKQYLQVSGWQHQKIDKPTFKYPKPPIELDDSSASSRRALDEESPTASLALGDGVEGKGREGKDQHNSLTGEAVLSDIPPTPKSEPSAIDPKAPVEMTLDWQPAPDLLKNYALRMGMAVGLFTHDAIGTFVCHYSASGRVETQASWVSLLTKWIKQDKAVAAATGNVRAFPARASAAPDFHSGDTSWANDLGPL